jgi:hypothetical protein
MTPLVTIVTSTNKTRVDQLSTAIRSALDQTWRNIEIIVSDDSPDQALKAVVEGFGDSRLRYRHNAAALGVARNHWAALREAKGDYIAVLNHDDCFDPTLLERLLGPLMADPAVVVAFCDHWIIDAEGVRSIEHTERSAERWGRASLRGGSHQPAYDLLAGQTIPLAIGALFPRRLVPANLPDHAGPAYDLWLTYFLCRDGGAVHYVPERLASWRAHAEGITSRGDGGWAYGTAECWRAVYTDPRLSSIHDVARKKAGAAYSAAAVNSWLAGRRRECARFAFRAVTAAPTWKAAATVCLPLLPRGLGAALLARARR